jgi:hypothetical protein
MAIPMITIKDLIFLVIYFIFLMLFYFLNPRDVKIISPGSHKRNVFLQAMRVKGKEAQKTLLSFSTFPTFRRSVSGSRESRQAT